MPKSTKQNCLIAFLFIFTLICDQITKIFVINRLNLGEKIDILPFFNFVRVHNKGVSFGLLSGMVQPLILCLLSGIIVYFLVIYAKENVRYRVPISLILGGALGNIIDRIRYGSVVDFLDFHLVGYHWPAFNVADSAITLGMFALIFISYREKKHA